MGGAVLVGGVGGGGDVGLALMLARAAGLGFDDLVVASFLKCSVEGDRLSRLRVSGSLIRIPRGYFADRRVFEDKVPLVIEGLDGRVYGLCTRDSWRDMVDGLGFLLDEHSPDCGVYADLGGDAALLGWEEKLGSFDTDTVARALLAWARRERGFESLLALGCVGCEGGGEWISEREAAASLLYLDSVGALHGVLDPPRDAGWIGEELLRYGESGMLPYYLAALRGERTAVIRMAYLSGEYPVRPWHRKVFLLDPLRSCEASPLCVEALGRGWEGLRRARIGGPPRGWRRLLEWVESRGVNAAFERLSRKRRSLRWLRRRCLRE